MTQALTERPTKSPARSGLLVVGVEAGRLELPAVQPNLLAPIRSARYLQNRQYRHQIMDLHACRTPKRIHRSNDKHCRKYGNTHWCMSARNLAEVNKVVEDRDELS